MDRKSHAERVIDYATRKLGHFPTEAEFNAMAEAGDFEHLLVTPEEEENAAEQYRLGQAQTILDVFEKTHGRPAKTLEELDKWVGSPEGDAALAPYRMPDGKITPTYR